MSVPSTSEDAVARLGGAKNEDFTGFDFVYSDAADTLTINAPGVGVGFLPGMPVSSTVDFNDGSNTTALLLASTSVLIGSTNDSLILSVADALGLTASGTLSGGTLDFAGGPEAFQIQRLTDRNGPSLEVAELTSNEVSQFRQETSIRSGFQQVTGQLGFELSYRSQDHLIELATTDAFAEISTAVADAWNDTNSTYTAVTKTFAVLDSIAADDVEQYVRGVYQSGDQAEEFSFLGLVESGTTIKVIFELEGTAPTADVAASSVKSLAVEPYKISMVRKGTMKYSTIVKDYPDILVSQAFGGCTVNNLSFSVQPGSLVTGTADILGVEAKNMFAHDDTDSATNTFNYAVTTGYGTGDIEPWRDEVSVNYGQESTAYSPFASCVAIDNAPNAIVSGFDFTINNNRETVPLLCSAFADSVYEGVANVSGTMTLLFENETEYNKFVLESESKVMISLDGGVADGADSMFFFFPRVRYTQPSFEIPANGPVVVTLTFRALQAEYGLDGAPVKTSCVIGRA
jgi:hypothetical protein